MKKIILSLVVLVILFISGVYLIIPKTLQVSNYTVLPTVATGVSRTLMQKQKWIALWTDKKQVSNSQNFDSSDLFFTNRGSLRVTELIHDALKIKVSNKDESANTLLNIIPLGKDSCVLNWSYAVETSSNPIVRFLDYQNAVGMKKTMQQALALFQKYLSDNKNIYGITIKEVTTVDTSLISTKKIFTHSPSTSEIYTMIDKLKNYAVTNHVMLPVNHPYLNITSEDSSEYRVMVALPIHGKLSTAGGDSIDYKKMIPGMFLTTTVQGGEGTVKQAYASMQQYFIDYKRVAMAIPFQVLITDRSQEKDTTKWVTELHFPVM